MSVKPSADYLNDKDLLTKSQLVVEVKVSDRGMDFIYEEVGFTNFQVKVLDVIAGKDVMKDQSIKILQTKIDSKDFPLLQRGESYILFLDKYVGPVTEDAYVVSGLSLGMLKEAGNQIEISDYQQKYFSILGSKERNKSSIAEMKKKIKSEKDI